MYGNLPLYPAYRIAYNERKKKTKRDKEINKNGKASSNNLIQEEIQMNSLGWRGRKCE